MIKFLFIYLILLVVLVLFFKGANLNKSEHERYQEDIEQMQSIRKDKYEI